MLVVSIHAPARGATAANWLRVVVRKFQSTPPRGGRRATIGDCKQPPPVSIHAPARGATLIPCEISFPLKSFNPRPREGGDRAPVHVARRRHPFQSTPPRGGRRLFSGRKALRYDVSIHAPARGATAGVLFDSPHAGSFNPRPREGGDWLPSGFPPSTELFQSTPPRGGRPTINGQISALQAFQSTPPRGGRPTYAVRFGGAVPVSIHAPARGATRLGRSRPVGYYRFNPRPREGGDERLKESRSMGLRFNPRPREGGDSAAAPGSIGYSRFNPRPREGGDRIDSKLLCREAFTSLERASRGNDKSLALV